MKKKGENRLGDNSTQLREHKKTLDHERTLKSQKYLET
jgi:hypothetical protein